MRPSTHRLLQSVHVLFHRRFISPPRMGHGFAYTHTLTDRSQCVGYASLFYGATCRTPARLHRGCSPYLALRYDRFESPRANRNALCDSRTFNVPTQTLRRVWASPMRNRSTVIKVSEVSSTSIPTNVWFNALIRMGQTVLRTSRMLRHRPVLQPSPMFHSTTGTVAIQNVTTVSPEFKNEYTWNINAQLSQQLSRTTPSPSVTSWRAPRI